MKKILVFITLFVFSSLLIACNTDNNTEDDKDSDTVTLGEEYSAESITENLGGEYLIRVQFTSNDQTSEYVIAKTGNKEFYSSDTTAYFVDGTEIYELDLENKTKTVVDEFMRDIVLISHEVTFSFLIEWADSIHNVATFLKNDTYLGRSAKIYSYKTTYQGYSFETRYTIDLDTKLAFKFEYLTSGGNISWEVTEFKLNGVSLVEYGNYELVANE